MQKLTIANIKNSARIHSLKIFNANVFTGLYKQIDLKITWDDEEKPAVWRGLYAEPFNRHKK